MQGLLDALGHPLRRDLLRLTFDHPTVTVRRASRHLRESQSTVRYHMTSLKDSGLVESFARKGDNGSLVTLWRSSERGRRAIAVLDELKRWDGW